MNWWIGGLENWWIGELVNCVPITIGMLRSDFFTESAMKTLSIVSRYLAVLREDLAKRKLCDFAPLREI